MRIGSKVIVTHPDAEFSPVTGVVVDVSAGEANQPILKVEHDHWENWYPKSWIEPLLRLV